MASTNGWISNFIQRCEHVGWKVERTRSNQYKVYDANDKMILTLPSTPSDRRATSNILAEARRHGLENLESRLKLRDERDRLEKIERDRESAEAKIAESNVRAVSDVAAESADSSSVEPAKATQPEIGSVAGIEIVTIEPVSFKTPVMPYFKELSQAEELLLADGTTVFRCARPAATPHRPDAQGPCHKTYPTAHSLIAHLRYHTRQVKDSSVETTKEAAVSAASTEITRSNGHSTEFAALDHMLAQAQSSVSKISDGFSSLLTELGSIRDAVRNLPVVDQETLSKAAQFDALGAIFKNAAGK